MMTERADRLERGRGEARARKRVARYADAEEVFGSNRGACAARRGVLIPWLSETTARDGAGLITDRQIEAACIAPGSSSGRV
jgi:hypothetical protein